MIPNLLRKSDVRRATGLCNTALHEAIKSGHFVPPVKLSSNGRSVRFPDTEVEAIVKARIAGRSDDEVRSLVEALTRARAEMA